MNSRDFSRQSFLGAKSEEILANTRVTIVGLGGGGSHVAQQLAHLGVGNFRLIDPDAIESSNLNRLIGGTQKDVADGTPKVEIAKRLILCIRPWAQVETAKAKWQEADSLLKDSHIVFGCVDGYQERDFLEGACRRYGLPLIDIGMDVSALSENHFAVSGQMIMTLPNGPCMRCLGFITDELLSAEENRYGDAGTNPQVVWTNGMLASLSVGAFIKLFTPWYPVNEPFAWLELDGNKQVVAPSELPKYIPREDTCPHHGGADGLGDAFFSLSKSK